MGGKGKGGTSVVTSQTFFEDKARTRLPASVQQTRVALCNAVSEVPVDLLVPANVPGHEPVHRHRHREHVRHNLARVDVAGAGARGGGRVAQPELGRGHRRHHDAASRVALQETCGVRRREGQGLPTAVVQLRLHTVDHVKGGSDDWHERVPPGRDDREAGVQVGALGGERDLDVGLRRLQLFQHAVHNRRALLDVAGTVLHVEVDAVEPVAVHELQHALRHVVSEACGGRGHDLSAGTASRADEHLLALLLQSGNLGLRQCKVLRLRVELVDDRAVRVPPDEGDVDHCVCCGQRGQERVRVGGRRAGGADVAGKTEGLCRRRGEQRGAECHAQHLHWKVCVCVSEQ
eukprot:Rhum_TRINITY_DN9122_c0_g1::Rhum_TRINITY_DN9122_c0_g1_i1::g.31787::m.31787